MSGRDGFDLAPRGGRDDRERVRGRKDFKVERGGRRMGSRQGIKGRGKGLHKRKGKAFEKSLPPFSTCVLEKVTLGWMGILPGLS